MNTARFEQIKNLLEEKYLEYNRPEFIECDPIQVPHMFSKPENIEIAGFLTATLAWGQRKTIINNAKKLMEIMENDPHYFLMHYDETDISGTGFKHRTFNEIDLKFFLKSLANIYKNRGGLRQIFEQSHANFRGMARSFEFFRDVFFEPGHEPRTRKHVADVSKGASAKRLNMFLRWMVRKDKKGVDFGLWNISPAALYIPLDVHTGNVARQLELLQRKQNDWRAVGELTNVLRKMDRSDPVKYDFALFGLGISENFVSS